MATKAQARLLAEALANSGRLQPTTVKYGAKELTSVGSPPRIVVVPTAFRFVSPEDKDNLADRALTVQCHCWARNHDELESLVHALVAAVFDYRLAADVNIQHEDGDHDRILDTEEGEEASVRFTLRSPVERQRLPADGGTGSVDSISYARSP